jgi:uncharacterized protein (TIGR03435 family)
VNIAHRRLAEESFVLPIELTRTLIPNLKGCTRGIQFPREHLLTRCVKPKLFLKLERTHGCEAAEVMVEGRSTHPGHRCKIIHVQCLPVVLTQPIDRLCCSMVLVSQCSNGTQAISLCPLKESVDDLRPTGGLFTGNLPLVTYIAFAYKLSLDHEQEKLLLDSLPKWAAKQMFAVHARASSGNPTKDQYRLMMRSLLANRFKLVSHLEQRRVPVFALILVKPGTPGPNLRQHSSGPPCNVPASENGSVPLSDSGTPAGGSDSFPFNCGSFNLLVRPNNMVLTGSRDVTMAALAMWLSGSGPADLDRTVVDQTGLDGRFDFSLKWAYVPAGSSPSDTAHQPEFMGLTFKRALNEQLGLNLKPTIAPVDFFVVDHIETPSPN